MISPGKLSRAHAHLEGMGNCTNCHELRKPGVSPTRCLACHEPLAARLEARRGFHASLVEEDCAACHKEHFGRDFALVRLDTAGFAHERTGFELNGAHETLGCRECHAAPIVADPLVAGFKGEHGALERTFLGLPDACAGCHADDDPHGDQFQGRACTECHDTGAWEEVPRFDHGRTSYPLTGRHRTLACAECHSGASGPGGRYRTRWKPVAHGSCTSCHEEPHDGAMAATCQTCHTTAGWTRVRTELVEGRFDHSSSGFLLEGRHAEVSCDACHGRESGTEVDGELRIGFEAGTEDRTFPRPVVESCTSCHQDRHEGIFAEQPGGSDCRGCHGQDGWLPVDYGIERHGRETGFVLEGAHVVVPCASCHRAGSGSGIVERLAAGRGTGLEEGTLVLELGSALCGACHGGSDAHGDQFEGRSCGDCHDTDSFRIPDFDHEETRFRLEGAHRRLTCSSCHLPEPGQEDEQPPAGRVAAGARSGVAEPGGTALIRYRPLGMRCRDCHGGTS